MSLQNIWDCSPIYTRNDLFPQVYLTLSLPNFRRHLSSAFVLNKLSIGKKFICKVDQRRPRWDGSLAVSSESMLFAKAYYYRLWQWKSWDVISTVFIVNYQRYDKQCRPCSNKVFCCTHADCKDHFRILGNNSGIDWALRPLLFTAWNIFVRLS